MEQFILRYTSDTANAQSIVPIYFVHSIKHPFCPLPECWCHQNQQEIAKLLQHIGNGKMTLQEVAQIQGGTHGTENG